jgi:predicted aspartyl protease
MPPCIGCTQPGASRSTRSTTRRTGSAGDISNLWGVLDTGATSVLIPEKMAEALVATGAAHFTGETAEAVGPDGRVHEARMLILHRFTIGGRSVNDVDAHTGRDNAIFLIGQSALKKFGPMKIDMARSTVIFG